MTMRATALAAVLASSLLLPRLGRATEPNPLATCPGYRAALLDARGALDRGERDHAVLALQRAKTALEHCRRREAGGGNRVTMQLPTKATATARSA